MNSNSNNQNKEIQQLKNRLFTNNAKIQKYDFDINKYIKIHLIHIAYSSRDSGATTGGTSECYGAEAPPPGEFKNESKSTN